MTINQTSLTQTLTYLALAKQLSNSNSSTNNSFSKLLSCLGSNGNSTDLSPILNLAILSSCCSNNNNNIFSSFMNILSNIMMMSFLKDLFSDQAATSTSGSKKSDNTSSKKSSSSNSTDSTKKSSGNSNKTSSSTNKTSSSANKTSSTAAAASSSAPQTAATVPASPATIRDTAIAIADINDDNIDSTLKNQKGTSFVIVCGEKCGRCKEFEPMLESINNSLGTKATFYNLNGSDKNADHAYFKLKNEAKAYSGTYSYPIIIKCVDGVAQRFYDYNDIKSIFKSESKITEWFSEKI